MATAATALPLITTPVRFEAVGKRGTRGRTIRIGLGLTLVALVLATYWPTVNNGFLPFGFDDAIIADTPELRDLTWANAGTILTTFNHAHYVPLTMLSLALDYSVWGLDPFGYHLTNVLVHAAATVLAYLWLLGVLPTWYAALAAAIFAVHPLQMEAVSVAMQRKTLLSGALFLATLIWYQQWCRRGKPWLYLAALITYVAAALAKPVVASLPCILLLYEYAFVDVQRRRVAHVLPFFVIAGATCLAAAAAHAQVGATHGPHGGTVLVHVLIVSRALLESVTALVLPLNLAPLYYYPKDAGYAPLNFVALASIPLLLLWVTLQRVRHPWSFFCAWWIAVVCAPEANIFPLAQLRADRFMYLAALAAGIGFAVALRWMGTSLAAASVQRAKDFFVPAIGIIVLALLAGLSYRSAAVWRNDITAWTRVVDRHSWSVTAHTMLGRAYLAHGDAQAAERLFDASSRINASVADPYIHLAQLYVDRGERERARMAFDRLQRIAPDHPETQRLRAVVSE